MYGVGDVVCVGDVFEIETVPVKRTIKMTAAHKKRQESGIDVFNGLWQW